MKPRESRNLLYCELCADSRDDVEEYDLCRVGGCRGAYVDGEAPVEKPGIDACDYETTMLTWECVADES